MATIKVTDENFETEVIKSQKPVLSGKADNPLLTTNFTLENFKKVFYENNFVELLLTTFYFINIKIKCPNTPSMIPFLMKKVFR